VWVITPSTVNFALFEKLQKGREFDEEEASSVRMRSRSWDGERREFFHVIVR
jgi:hypothetical protein